MNCSKAVKSVRSDFGGPLKGLIADKILRGGFGVYTGATELNDGPLRVLPLGKFLQVVAEGNLFEQARNREGPARRKEELPNWKEME